MSKDKPTPGGRGKKKTEVLLVRSSAAEYLTFLAASGSGGVEAVYADENVWLSQKMMGQLYDVETHTINYHLKKIFADSELQEDSVIRNFRITAADGKTYDTQHYNLTDIYATALDYDPSATATQRFFAAVQNTAPRASALRTAKPFRRARRRRDNVHYAVHGQTAAELIVDRADHEKQNMGLTSWEGAPTSKIHRYDVSIAKNYLADSELEQMQRIVSAYLDMAEMQATRNIPMTMEDWEKRLSGFLQLWDREILQDAGKVTAELAKAHAESEFEKYRIVQDRLFESDFDRLIKEQPEKGDKTHAEARRTRRKKL